MTQFPPPAWTQPGWLDEVKEWIQAALAHVGLALTWPIERVQERPWSIIIRVPSAAAGFYFKACAPVSIHEAGITAALYRWQPDCIPAVLDADPQKGWFLMADGGQTLRHAFRRSGSPTAPTVDSWREILLRYAALQIDLVPRVNQLLQLGAPDQRLAIFPDRYQDLLAEPDYLLIDQPDGLTTAEYERLLAAAPQVTALCQELGAYNVPMSLHHNDLHDANIFFADSRPLFFDWGDSAIAHPFFSLRTLFVSIEYSFALDEADPIFAELAEAYLQPWAVVETKTNLTAAFALARRLWALSTALKYKRQLRQLPAMRAEYALAVPRSLQEFLTMNPEL